MISIQFQRRLVTNIHQGDTVLHLHSLLLRENSYPTLAREFQGFRVWGKFVFRTLELTDTPTNLTNQVKIGHALDQSRSVQSRGPKRAHQNNEPSWRSSRTDRRFRGSFETIDWLYLVFTCKCGIKQKSILNGFSDNDLHSVSWT